MVSSNKWKHPNTLNFFSLNTGGVYLDDYPVLVIFAGILRYLLLKHLKPPWGWSSACGAQSTETLQLKHSKATNKCTYTALTVSTVNPSQLQSLPSAIGVSQYTRITTVYTVVKHTGSDNTADYFHYHYRDYHHFQRGLWTQHITPVFMSSFILLSHKRAPSCWSDRGREG